MSECEMRDMCIASCFIFLRLKELLSDYCLKLNNMLSSMTLAGL